MHHAGVKSAGLVLCLAAMGYGLPTPASGAGAPVVESKPLSQAPGQAGSSTASVPMRLEDRVARLERQAENQALVDMLSRIDALQREVEDLRGLLEVQTHKAEGIEQRQRELYLDTDRRLRQMESKTSAASDTTGATAATPGVPSAPSPVVSGTSSPATATTSDTATGNEGFAEREAYQRAFDLMKAGRYDESIAAFRSFLARYPDGEYSANAQYWLGEANYVTRRFGEAATEFGRVIQFFPDSSKAPDALLKLGFSQYELQEWEKAGETLNRLIQQYPKSTARQLAESRLQRMRMEGR